MIKLVSDCAESDSLNKLSFDHVMAFYIGRCKILRYPDGTICLNLDEGFDKEYGEIWRNDVGGILKKELKKNEPCIYELIDSKFKALLKKISDDELEEFRKNKHAHVKICGEYYTIIRIIKSNGSYSKKDFKNDYYYDIDIDDYIYSEKEDDCDVEDEQSESVTLF